MLKINPYLNFPGNAEEAFNFYKSVFGGEFAYLQRYKDVKDLPNADKFSESDKEKIMHISLPIGKENVLMASDSIASMGHPIKIGDNFNLSISTESEKEADEIFGRLAAGGKVEMALEKTFWGAYFGMLQDKFGIWWMISYDYNLKTVVKEN
ncbi:MAG: VOC family protein [Candidatus Pacebacteria bacterium]|nr:VOC family protein [Candidatus Paceibacterota bacterium]